MKRSGSSDDRGRRLGPNARGSMDFLLLCMKRGVPPEKISGFLVGLGIDAGTVNRWMDHLKREMAGIPERTVSGNFQQKPVGRPAGTVPMTLEGKTATDFVLPDLLDATKTKVGDKNPLITEEQTINVSLEISQQELQKAAQEAVSPARRLAGEVPASMLVSSSLPERPVPAENERVQLEKPRSGKKRRKSRSNEGKFLSTPQGRLAAFAAAVLLTWLLSDAGWFPGGSARHATMPANEVLTREEPLAGTKPPDAPVADANARQAPQPGEADAQVQEYPDPWATPAAKSDSDRAPSSNQPPSRRPKHSKRPRPSY